MVKCGLHAISNCPLILEVLKIIGVVHNDRISKPCGLIVVPSSKGGWPERCVRIITPRNVFLMDDAEGFGQSPGCSAATVEAHEPILMRVGQTSGDRRQDSTNLLCQD